MKTIYIQPVIGTLFAIIGILFGLIANRIADRGNSLTRRVHFKLALVFLMVGIGLWIWYLI